jgi:uncharacterized protein YraI
MTRRTPVWLWLLAAVIIAAALIIQWRMIVSPGELFANDAAWGAAVAAPVANLQVYSGPGNDFEQIGSVPAGVSFPVAGRSSDSTWLLVELSPGRHGWIKAWLCVISGSLEIVPVFADDGVLLLPLPLVTAEPDQAAEVGVPTVPVEPTQADEQVPLDEPDLPGDQEQPDTPVALAAQTASAAPPDDSGPVTAAAMDDLLMRAGPSTDYVQAGSIPRGATLAVLGRAEAANWILVSHNGAEGWVAAWLCSLEGPLSSVPVSDRVMEIAEVLEPEVTETPDVEVPVVEATPTPTAVVVAAPANPSGLPYHVTLTMGANTWSIYQHGLALGNNPHAFSKVGDSETADGHFMEPYDLGTYTLGDYAYLAEVIQHFQGSFGRQSMTAYPAFSVHHVLDPTWANPEVCEPDETPLACEYRVHRPSFALVLVRSWNADVYPGELEQIIQYSVDRGVVPVLSTCPYQPGGPWASETVLNPIIRGLAAQYGVPLWDLHVTTEQLPDRGTCDPCGDHLTMPPAGSPFSAADFVGPSFQYGATMRNLEGLQVLYTMLHEVVQ